MLFEPNEGGSEDDKDEPPEERAASFLTFCSFFSRTCRAFSRCAAASRLARSRALIDSE